MHASVHPLHDLTLLAAEPTGGDAPQHRPAQTPTPQRGIGAAWLMAGSMMLGVGLGLALDRHFGTSPRWTIGLSMTFMVVGIYQTIREANR